MVFQKFRPAAVGDMLVCLFRWVWDSTIHWILAVMHFRGKTGIPRIKNELLLEPAVQLAAKIREGKLSSETLVRVYIERITEVNEYLNAVVDSRYAEALEEARQVDQLVQSGTFTDQQMAEDLPLLGIPFTAKEILSVKGLSDTVGMVRRKGMIALEDCESVKKMRSCGAIPVANTVIPEMSFGLESRNKMHGRTKNPYDIRRTSGGSSGGEGALIGAGASLIGLASDFGGSIRIPAFFNGIFGHMPTRGFVPLGGIPYLTTELQQYTVVGPMVRYAVDLKFVLSALIGKEAAQKLKLFETVDVKSIKVYYMLDNGGEATTTPVSPDIKNGMKTIICFLVVKMLSNDGFTVKEVNLKYLQNGIKLWDAFLLNIDHKLSKDLQEGGTYHKYFSLKEMSKYMFGKSNHMFNILFFTFFQDVIQPLLPNFGHFYRECSTRMIRELLDLLEPEPSVFLYPTFPEVAPYHGETFFKHHNYGYFTMFNIAALPVTQCPLGLDSSNLPFGMQIVTARNNDRLSIALAEYIEEKTGGWVQPS